MRPVLLLMAMAGNAHAKGDFSVRQISMEVWREPDGKKYPNQVKETYLLDKGGRLEYTAYFGGMPIEMNHMDSVEWAAGAQGRALLELAQRLANQGALRNLPDDESAPAGAGVYVVGVTRADADSTMVASDVKTAAWQKLDAAFRALVKKFERATRRPRNPGDLPQR